MFKVEAERDPSGWWVASSIDVPGMVTQAKRLDQIHSRAVEAIAVLLDRDIDSSEIELVVHTEFDDDIERYRKARAEADRAAEDASRAARVAATALRSAGFSLRDAGEVLGISYQRVDQLVSTSPIRTVTRVHRPTIVTTED